ncbi:hypothetical protein GGR52DRAFT_576346 [Hypoxylon sp. FL1284]|nr:hypothetical protein GGR52DRAFT_576346 [Hypoxylon sp. FL1284]
MPALPPPPTRSRKIIKMQPGPQEEPTAQATQENAVSTGVAESADGAVSKRKLPSVDSDEARKEARKDAHSEIERRRRSKTNGAYSTLEELIPACAEEELTKLGILEETIKYVRYLQDCNRKLVEHCKGYGEDDGNDADDEEYEEETRQGAGMTNLKGPLHAHTGTLTQTARNTKKRRRSHFSASTKGPHLSYTSPATSSSSFSLQANPERTDASTMERVLHSPAVTCQQQQQQQQQDEESLRVASAALANLKSDRRGTSNGESSNFLRRISINDIVGPHNGN